METRRKRSTALSFRWWVAAACVLAALGKVVGQDFDQKELERRLGREEFSKLEDLGRRLFRSTGTPIDSVPGLVERCARVESELTTDDGKALLHRMLAGQAGLSGDREREKEHYRVIVEDYPDTLVAPFCSRELMARSEQTRDYATLLSAAAVATRYAQSADQKFETARATCYALAELGEYDEAVRYLETAMDGGVAASGVNQLLNNVGVRLLHAGQSEKAERLLLLAYEAVPPEQRDVSVLNNLTLLANTRGRVQDAIRYQEEARARTTDPATIAEIEFAIAGFYLQLGRFDDAKKSYQAVLDSSASSTRMAQLRKLAQENIENATASDAPRSEGEKFRPEVPQQSQWWSVITAINVAVLALLACAVIWRQRVRRGRK